MCNRCICSLVHDFGKTSLTAATAIWFGDNFHVCKDCGSELNANVVLCDPCSFPEVSEHARLHSFSKVAAKPVQNLPDDEEAQKREMFDVSSLLP